MDMMYGTWYQLAIPAVWALIATGTAIVFLATVFGIFFFWIYIVTKIVSAVVYPIKRIMDRAYDN